MSDRDPEVDHGEEGNEEGDALPIGASIECQGKIWKRVTSISHNARVGPSPRWHADEEEDG